MRKKGIIRKPVAFIMLLLLFSIAARAQVPTMYPPQTSNEAAYISWAAFTGATSYTLYWSTVSGTGTAGTPITISGGGAKMYFHTGLTGGTTYYYVVVGVVSGSPSLPSAEVSVTPVPQYSYYAGSNGDGHSTNKTCVIKPGGTAATPYSQPITVYASVEQNYVVWPQEAGATGYTLEFSTTSPSGPWTSLYTGTNLTYTHTSLTGGTTYYYRVTAALSGCPLNPSLTVSGLVMPQYSYYAGSNGDGHSMVKTCVIKPSGISAAPNSQNVTVYAHVEQNFIFWPQESGATGYALEFSTTGPAGPWTSLYTGTNLYYVHTALTGGTTYYYRVTANLAGCPLNPSATASGLVMPLYSYYAGSIGDGHSMLATCTMKLDGANAAPNSLPMTVYAHIEQNFLYWPQQSGASSYALEYCTTGPGGPFTLLYSGLNLYYTHASLTGGTTYYYRVTANLTGCPLNPSAVVNATSMPLYSYYAGSNGDGHSMIGTCTMKLDGANAAPNSLPMTVYAHVEQNFLYWPQQTGASSYTLEFSTNGPGGPFTSLYSGLNLYYTHTSLTGGTTYYYRVTANLPGCPLNPSAVVNATAVPLYSYYAGSNGDGYSLGGTCNIDLDGGAATPNSQAITVYAHVEQNFIFWPQEVGASTYVLEYALNQAGPFTQLYSGSLLYYTHTGLTGGQTYYYQVTAVPAGCPLNASDVVSGTAFPQYSYYAGSGGDGHSMVTSCMGVSLNLSTITVNPSNYSNLCQGDVVTLTAADGGTWLWNTGATTQAINVTTDGSYFVAVSGVFACNTISDTVTLTFSPSTPPVVSITPDANPVCAGTTVSFNASATNGGSAPSYQWQVNGSNAGTGISTYTYAPANGDVVQCILVSNSACASPATATSSVTMTVNPNVTPIVSIGASPAGAICIGTSVTFTASPTNGGTPTYQWQLNGSNTVTGASYTSSLLADNDVVSCTMISNASCVSPATATTSVTMTVNPILTPSVSVAASPAGAICAGTSVTFTPTPTNGGTPIYNWYKNGSGVGTGSTYSSSTLANNDVISCMMVSNATCVSPVTATTSVTMTVNPSLTPLVSVSASPSGAICPGTSVTFTASPTNGGTPSYQWQLNGTNTVTGVSYSSSALANNDVVSCIMISNATCASPVTATTSLTVSVKTLSVAPTGASAVQSLICAGGSSTLSVTGGTPGTGAVWEWYSGSCGGTPAGSGASISVSPSGTTTYYVRSEGDCNTTLCESVAVTVKTVSVAPTLASALPATICSGSSSTLSFTGGTLGTGATWQWYSGSCGGTPLGSGTSIAVTPASTSTYYVRGEGDCNNSPCASVIVTVNFCLVSWTGAVDSNWNNVANWSSGIVPNGSVDVSIPAGRPHQPEIFVAAQCQGLTIASGAVLTIRPKFSLTARGTTTLNGAQCLVIKSNVTGSGSFIDNGSITGSGTAKVERYITATNWHYIGSPIQSATAAVYSGNYLKKWLEPTYTWQNLTSTSTPLVVGTGYALKTLSTNTYNYIGKLNFGTYNFPVTRNTTQIVSKRGWNLMGNPYPSAINWDAGSGWTKTNVYNSIYIYNQAYGTYATYVNGIGTNGASPYIASGQGFFVVCSASPGGTLGMNTSVRVHKDTTFFKSQAEPDMVRLNLEDNAMTDDIIIRIDPNATPNFDSDFDAFKMTVPGVSQLWSNPVNGDIVDYAINSLPDVMNNPDVPVAFMPAHSGNYIIRATDHQSLGMQTSIYLEDL